jgi:hypothetical protein
MRPLFLITLVACSSNPSNDGLDPFALGACGSSWDTHGEPTSCSRECFDYPGGFSGPACTAADEPGVSGSGTGIMCAHTFIGSDGYQGCCFPVQPSNQTFFECE